MPLTLTRSLTFCSTTEKIKFNPSLRLETRAGEQLKPFTLACLTHKIDRYCLSLFLARVMLLSMQHSFVRECVGWQVQNGRNDKRDRRVINPLLTYMADDVARDGSHSHIKLRQLLAQREVLVPICMIASGQESESAILAKER